MVSEMLLLLCVFVSLFLLFFSFGGGFSFFGAVGLLVRCFLFGILENFSGNCQNFRNLRKIRKVSETELVVPNKPSLETLVCLRFFRDTKAKMQVVL